MSDTTTASAGAATATPVNATAPAPTVPETATPLNTKTALDFINTPGDALAARYGFAESDELPGDLPEAPAEPAAVAEPAPVAEPVAAPTTEPVAAEPFTPITKFTLHDDQGEFEIPENVKLTFNAGGKEYKGLRIDEVVRMAQQAPMAVKHQQEAEQLKPIAEQAQAIAQAHQQALQELQRNNALYEELLSNPALYQEAATRYQALNTPDQRIARLEEQRAAERQQYQQNIQQTQLQQTITAAANYTASRIAPSVESLTTQYPQVDASDVMDRFNTLTAPLLESGPNGKPWVPPHRLQELETTVLPQLTEWTKARAAKATQASAAATQQIAQQATQASAQVKQAQLAAQLAQRQLVRPLTPAGTPPAADTPRPKPIKTSGDAIDSILDKARRQINQGAA